MRSYIGLGASKEALLAAGFLAGFCVLGVQSGINVCGALVYPTSLRALVCFLIYRLNEARLAQLA